MKRLVQTLLIFVVAAGLSACAAKTAWNKPGASPEQARAALAECRARANVDVEDRYGRDVDGGSGGVGQEFRSSVSRNQATRALDRAIADCMTGKGYLR